MTTSTTDAEAIAPFAQYRRRQIAELRPWRPGDYMSGVSVPPEDAKAGSPKLGDMIARNPKNHADQWLVAAQYFADNFEPLAASRREAQEPIHQYRRRGCSDWYDGHPDRSDGKDYETRVVYLGPPEAQEPVAWLRRPKGYKGGWVSVHTQSKPNDGDGIYEVLPVYTAPPSGEVERLRGALQRAAVDIKAAAVVIEDQKGEPALGLRQTFSIIDAALNGGRSE